MLFRDECTIAVLAGKGGDGMVSFRREKYVPKGGPNGGDGGHGGSVILRAASDVHSLLDIGRQLHYRAEDGQPGGPNDCTGKSGADLVLTVPIGTQIRDARRKNLLADLAHAGEEVEVARGGRGGKGNAAFATAVRQAPRTAEPGGAGEARELDLELKLFADVGLVGLPNAGKSTFLSRVTAATPKIADYPFTTLVPQVGIAAVGEHDTLVLADLPGLIEGAAEGIGLGHRFLRHVERCRALLHLIDVSAGASEEPLDALRTVRAELERYSAELARRPALVVASKVEDEVGEARALALEAELGSPVWRISAVQGRGLAPLLEAVRKIVRAAADERPLGSANAPGGPPAPGAPVRGA